MEIRWKRGEIEEREVVPYICDPHDGGTAVEGFVSKDILWNVPTVYSNG